LLNSGVASLKNPKTLILGFFDSLARDVNFEGADGAYNI
jgi:hypothetical protein